MSDLPPDLSALGASAAGGSIGCASISPVRDKGYN
jgi:hypothetical protein